MKLRQEAKQGLKLWKKWVKWVTQMKLLYLMIYLLMIIDLEDDDLTNGGICKLQDTVGGYASDINVQQGNFSTKSFKSVASNNTAQYNNSLYR